jgi:uncharacterized protein YidB (DUF937 family)
MQPIGDHWSPNGEVAMGLNDMLAKLGGQGGQEGGLGALSKLISSNGGLQGMAAKLADSGMGQQVRSWVGQGKNQPVTGHQVQEALDTDSVNRLAQQTGQTPEQASEQVAKVLPEMVNQATPQGDMPSDDPFAKGMAALKNLVGR